MARENITLTAQAREETGKNAMRRLRRAGLIPGIVFGRSGDTVQVKFDPKELDKVVHSESGFNTIFIIDVDSDNGENKPNVIVKDYQLDPVTHKFLHVSFFRIHMDRVMEFRVPLVADGQAPGVKDQGGVLEIVNREIDVECLPADIPDAFHVDISEMEIHDVVRLKDLTIAENVSLLLDPEAIALHIVLPKKIEEPEPEVELDEEGEPIVAEEAEGEEGEGEGEAKEEGEE